MLLRTQFQKQIYDYIYSLANHINYCCSWLHVTLYFCTKYVNLILLNFAEFFLPDIITMAYFLCKLKICIYVYTVGICSYILPSINAMVNQNTDIKNKHLRKPAFKFYICLLLFKNCIFGFDGLFRGPLIDREICTDWRQILLAISIYLFSLHNNNVIVRKKNSINRWCYMVMYFSMMSALFPVCLNHQRKRFMNYLYKTVPKPVTLICLQTLHYRFYVLFIFLSEAVFEFYVRKTIRLKLFLGDFALV